MRGKDLLSQLPKAPLITAPKNLVKSIILDAVIVILAVVSGIFFASYLAGLKTLVWPLVSVGVFMAFSVLGTLLTNDLWHRLLVIVLASLGFLVSFLGAPLNLLGASLAVMIILLVWGEYLSREDAANSVEIRFFRVTKRPLSKMLTAIAIVAIILYVPTWNKKTIFISQSTFDSIYSWSSKFAQGLYPEYKLDSDLGTFARSVAKSQLERNMNFSLLPTAIKEKTLNDLGGQIVGNLSKFFGFTLDAKNTFGDAIYAFINKSLADLKGKFGATFITVWAIAVFLFVRGVATLFGYLVSFLSFLIYHALIAFQVIRVRTENKPHEIVEFF
ncbi:MAG: hypothetical protein LiPW15_130 [Parcubacteria group bacterium LiPW_15]|nr:MAG: hypothetical protein LiPW15_130 [Parcubacteria group bacterium LiPW_15]